MRKLISLTGLDKSVLLSCFSMAKELLFVIDLSKMHVILWFSKAPRHELYKPLYELQYSLNRLVRDSKGLYYI